MAAHFTPAVGALYSVADGQVAFRIVKVLAVDERGVHLRLYADRFAERPRSVDPRQLRGESTGQALAIGHVPVLYGGFLENDPVFLAQSTVDEDELDGHEEWASAQGGYFTDVTIAIQTIAGALSRIREQT